jgi:hypothetical protein
MDLVLDVTVRWGQTVGGFFLNLLQWTPQQTRASAMHSTVCRRLGLHPYKPIPRPPGHQSTVLDILRYAMIIERLESCIHHEQKRERGMPPMILVDTESPGVVSGLG